MLGLETFLVFFVLTEIVATLKILLDIDDIGG